MGVRHLHVLENTTRCLNTLKNLDVGAHTTKSQSIAEELPSSAETQLCGKIN